MLWDYLSVGNVEIVNHARLDAYVSTVGCPLDTGSTVCRCETLDAEMLGDEPYTSPDDPNSPAPWYDEDVPASGEFAGLMVMDMEGIDDRPVKREVTNAVGGGGSIGPGLVQPRTIVVTALVLGSTCCGVEYGLHWLGEALAGCTGTGCGAGDCMTIYTCCPPEDMEPGDFDWQRRTLRRVALVEGPTVIERTGDGCHVAAGECDAAGTDVVKVEFILTAATPWFWTDPLPILEVAPPTSDEDCVTWCLSTPDGVECFEAVTACPNGGVPVVEDCGTSSPGEESLGEGGCGLCWPVTPDDCGKECRHAKCVDPQEGCGDPTCTPATPPAPVMPATCFCLPLAAEQECFDLDLSDRPAWSDDVPMITVRAPEDRPVRGLTITFYERTDEHESASGRSRRDPHREGSPGELSPGEESQGEESLGESLGEESAGEESRGEESLTCEEIANAERCNPHSMYHVQFVPPGGVLTLDGQIGRAMVECNDTCESSPDVYGDGGAPPSWRPFDCAQLCVCISQDVSNPAPGASVEVAVSGRGY